MTGAEEVQRELERLTALYPASTAAALYQWGMRFASKMKPRIPIRDYRLRDSTYAAPPVQQGGEAVVEIGVGTVYARRQHFELDWHHPKGGEALYMQKTLDENEGAFPSEMIKLIRSNVARGVRVEAIPAAVPAAPATGENQR